MAIAERIPMIATTIISSISVKPLLPSLIFLKRILIRSSHRLKLNSILSLQGTMLQEPCPGCTRPRISRQFLGQSAACDENSYYFVFGSGNLRAAITIFVSFCRQFAPNVTVIVDRVAYSVIHGIGVRGLSPRGDAEEDAM